MCSLGVSFLWLIAASFGQTSLFFFEDSTQILLPLLGMIYTISQRKDTPREHVGGSMKVVLNGLNAAVDGLYPHNDEHRI